MTLLNLVGAHLRDRTRDLRLDCHNDPVKFANEYIEWPDGKGLAPYQAEMMSQLVEQKRVSARGPHGLGKTGVAAMIILWFANTREIAQVDWKIISTASAWRQITEYLWPEVHLWARRLRWDKLEREPYDERTELMTTMLRLDHGRAIGAASDDPALLEGAHAESILVVFDEAKSIPAGTWEALEGALSGMGEAFALAISTPGAPSGVFFNIHQRKPGYEDWWVRHVTVEEAIEARRISPTWVEARRRQWGENSAVFQNRVLGKFASSDEDSVIPLEWVELAVDRWKDWTKAGKEFGPLTGVGVDVARSGTDKTCLALRHSNIISELRYTVKEDTMETTGHVAGILGKEENAGARAVVDLLGIGAGVYDRLRELNYRRVFGFNAGAHTDRVDRSGELQFVDVRSAAWWWLRECLDPTFGAVLALPDDDLLIGDLTAPKYSTTSTGKIKVESKDDLRKRIGRSTDSGDAVVQVMFDEMPGPGVPVRPEEQKKAEVAIIAGRYAGDMSAGLPDGFVHARGGTSIIHSGEGLYRVLNPDGTVQENPSGLLW